MIYLLLVMFFLITPLDAHECNSCEPADSYAARIVSISKKLTHQILDEAQPELFGQLVDLVDHKEHMTYDEQKKLQNAVGKALKNSSFSHAAGQLKQMRFELKTVMQRPNRHTPHDGTLVALCSAKRTKDGVHCKEYVQAMSDGQLRVVGTDLLNPAVHFKVSNHQGLLAFKSNSAGGKVMNPGLIHKGSASVELCDMVDKEASAQWSIKGKKNGCYLFHKTAHGRLSVQKDGQLAVVAAHKKKHKNNGTRFALIEITPVHQRLMQARCSTGINRLNNYFEESRHAKSVYEREVLFAEVEDFIKTTRADTQFETSIATDLALRQAYTRTLNTFIYNPRYEKHEPVAQQLLQAIYHKEPTSEPMMLDYKQTLTA